MKRKIIHFWGLRLQNSWRIGFTYQALSKKNAQGLSRIKNITELKLQWYWKIKDAKSPPKQEGTIFYCDARFLHVFFFIYISCLQQKKTCKKAGITTNIRLFLFCHSFNFKIGCRILQWDKNLYEQKLYLTTWYHRIMSRVRPSRPWLHWIEMVLRVKWCNGKSQLSVRNRKQILFRMMKSDKCF